MLLNNESFDYSQKSTLADFSDPEGKVSNNQYRHVTLPNTLRSTSVGYM
jgi:hypothetical protein